MIITDFNYLLILGTSGVGKTTYAKHIVSKLKEQGYECRYYDHNDQWWDLGEAISPEDLLKAVNRVAQPLLYRGRRGVLVIEDFKQTISSLERALSISKNRVRAQIRECLENVRKYGVKVILLGHLIDREEMDMTTLQLFDTIVFFRTPLTDYKARQLDKLGFDGFELRALPRYHYRVYNGVEFEVKGVVEEHKSHAKVEAERDFQIKKLLNKCESISQRALVLKCQLGMSNQEVAETLTNLEGKEITLNHVRVIFSRWRKRGVDVPKESVVDVSTLLA